MKLLFILLLAGLLPGALLGQTFSFPKFSKSVRIADDLAGGGWNVLDTVAGDLNKDDRADLAVVMEYGDSVREKRADSVRYHRPRVLVILFQDSATGMLRPVCQNNTIIARGDEDWMDKEKDPHDAPTIDNGVLWVNVSYTRISENYKFRWQKGNFYLIGATMTRWWANANEEYDINFSTRKKSHFSSEEGPHREHTEWSTLNPGPLVSLQTVGETSELHVF